MEDNNAVFHFREEPRYDHVDEDRYCNYKPCEKRAMPLLRVVRVRVVEDDQTLQNGACEDRLRGYGSNPGQARQPAHEIAQHLLVPLGREHVHPVVLAGGDGRNGRELRDDRIHGEGGRPRDDEAIDQRGGPAVVEPLAEEREDRFPRDEFTDSKAKEGPEAETSLEDLFLA